MAPGSQLAGLSRGTGWERVFYSGPAAPLGLTHPRGPAGAGGGAHPGTRSGCATRGEGRGVIFRSPSAGCDEEGATESLSRGAPRVTWGWGAPSSSHGPSQRSYPNSLRLGSASPRDPGVCRGVTCIGVRELTPQTAGVTIPAGLLSQPLNRGPIT